jgi:carbon storage regulator
MRHNPPANLFQPHRGREGSVMLVLNRKRHESIIIGDNIVVTVVEICGKQVKLGIQAPDDVVILRTELVDRQEEPDED